MSTDRSYDQYMRDRHKVKNLVGYGAESSQDFPRCPNCIDQPRLQVQKDSDDNRIGVCIKSCGQTFQLEKTINEETGGTLLAPKKYTSKFGTIGKQHSLIISQKRKKRDGQLNESDKADLSLLGSSGGEGATKVDERTEYYQDGGARS